MANRINIGLKALCGAAMLMLVVYFASVQFRNTSMSKNDTDNRLIAFASAKDGNSDIYTMHADGSELVNLTNSPEADYNPVWSPDGRQIAFNSIRDWNLQIFLMNSDGSNILQLTADNANHLIGTDNRQGFNSWSPDGNKLIFLRQFSGANDAMPYVIDINGENKKTLAKKAGSYSSPSWSPDGKHIAFIAVENDVARIYTTDAEGKNTKNITELLPPNETIDPLSYYWSRDGKSIHFIASDWNRQNHHSDEYFSDNYKWTAYEASLDGSTVIANASAHSPMGGYWQGTYFLADYAMHSQSPTWTRAGSDGTLTTVNPLRNCTVPLDNIFVDSFFWGNNYTGYYTFKQSSNGNVVIGSSCPNGDRWLFLADSKDTFKPLLNFPIHTLAKNISKAVWAVTEFTWSPDDNYIAFNIYSPDKTDMYIVNVTESLKDPSIQPFQIALGEGWLRKRPSWQPIP